MTGPSQRPPARNRKAEQAERTRATLLRVARALFAERGYAGTSTEELVQRAGVTRGALYHHYRDKEEIFEAVFSEMQQEIRSGVRAAYVAQLDPWSAFRAGFEEYLNRAMDPAVQRIILGDAPSVLGWRRWQDADACFAMLQGALAALVRAQLVSPSFPVDETALLLRGVASEAVRAIAAADDRAAVRRQMGAAVDQLLEGLQGR